tara:strand:+ start:1404 stop:2183 length:780 start_codon:yes stop_codon:yes gene_type:complete
MSVDFMDAKSGTISGNLASGVSVSDGVLEYDFVVQEMTGVEEDLLGGKGPIMPRLNQVILNCLVSLGGVNEKSKLSSLVRALASVDRMILLIAIRRASLGDMYRVKFSCPSCQATNNASVDLSLLEVETSTTGGSQHKLELDSGRVIEWHTMTGIDEEWLQSQQKRQEKLGQSDVLTLAMLTRIDGVDGTELDRVKNLKESLKTLKNLRLSERNEIRSAFKMNEGSIDTEIEYQCSNCTNEFKSDLDVGQVGFFFPSGI